MITRFVICNFVVKLYLSRQEYRHKDPRIVSWTRSVQSGRIKDP